MKNQKSKCKNQKLTILIPLSSLFLLFTSSVYAASDVVINEFSSGTTQDWIELYNTGTASASLSNLRLRDSSTNKKDLTGEIIPGGFTVISFSNWLNNDGDIVKLLEVQTETETILEQIPYGLFRGLCAPIGEGSIGKLPDGSSTIKRFITYTKEVSNNSSQEDPCHTPTPIPTNVPTSTPTSAPSNTPSPSNTPKPQSTSTPTKLVSTVTKIPSLTVTSSPPATSFVSSPFLTSTSESAVLGETINQEVPIKKEEKSTNIFSILLITLGSLCVGIACILSFRQIKKSRMKS